jgi:photosystem II protein
MYLLDEEGRIVTRDVNARFVNGKPQGIEAVHIMQTKESWDRFMRFMERYSEDNGLTFTKSSTFDT